MKLRTGIRMSAFAILAGAISSMSWLHAQQRPAGASVAIDPDDIGGVVTSAKGPEAGVWVIAETTETPTKFARIVVTDDQGRYVLPDLPPASYQVFVRGYGLVDSQRQTAKRGQQLNLTAQVAPDAKAAAQVYPAAYWLSMLKLPEGAKAQRVLKSGITARSMGRRARRWPSSSSVGETLARRSPIGPMPSQKVRFQPKRPRGRLVCSGISSSHYGTGAHQSTDAQITRPPTCGTRGSPPTEKFMACRR